MDIQNQSRQLCKALATHSESHTIKPQWVCSEAKLQALVYDILPSLGEGAGKWCSECARKHTPFPHFSPSLISLKPVLNWANVCSPEHTSDTSTNYDSFLNWTFSSPNMVRTVQTLLHSQLACNEMQASARTCGWRAADSMIENVG